MTELLNCPFCGSPASIEQVSNDDSWWIIRCTDQADDAAMACSACPEVQEDNREIAIAHWNHREPEARSALADVGEGPAPQFDSERNRRLNESTNYARDDKMCATCGGAGTITDTDGNAGWTCYSCSNVTRPSADVPQAAREDRAYYDGARACRALIDVKLIRDDMFPTSHEHYDLTRVDQWLKDGCGGRKEQAAAASRGTGKQPRPAAEWSDENASAPARCTHGYEYSDLVTEAVGCTPGCHAEAHQRSPAAHTAQVRDALETGAALCEDYANHVADSEDCARWNKRAELLRRLASTAERE